MSNQAIGSMAPGGASGVGYFIKRMFSQVAWTIAVSAVVVSVALAGSYLYASLVGKASSGIIQFAKPKISLSEPSVLSEQTGNVDAAQPSPGGEIQEPTIPMSKLRGAPVFSVGKDMKVGEVFDFVVNGDGDAYVVITSGAKQGKPVLVPISDITVFAKTKQSSTPAIIVRANWQNSPTYNPSKTLGLMPQRAPGMP